MYQSEQLEFVVNQSIWFEGEAKFADVDPAGLHQFRAHRHLGMGGARRLRPSRPAAAQPPRHHLPGAGDRAARRIEVRLLDLQRDLQAARPVQLFLRGHQRDRLGQAHLSRLRPAEGDLVQEAAEARLLRRAGREGEAARAGVVPLVLGEPQEGRAGGAAAAVGLHRGIPAAACRPSPASSSSSATASSASRTRSGRRSSNTSRRGRARTRRSSSAIRCSCSRRTRSTRSTPRATARARSCTTSPTIA